MVKATGHFEIYPGAIERLLRSPQSKAQRRKSAEKVADAWQANIHNITGATDASIGVEDHGDDVTVTADSARNPNTAWAYLEYGTSKMAAQSPGRRAIRRG